MNVPNQILVDGVEMQVVRVGKTVHGFTGLFLGHNAQAEQRHMLPADWITNGRGVTCNTGGHTYSHVKPR